MIIDCTPFAVWISLGISLIILTVLALYQDWFDGDIPSELVVVAALVFFALVTIVTDTIVVQENREIIKAKIVHTKQEMVAFDLTTKEVICVLPKTEVTNCVHFIYNHKLVSFLNVTLTNYYTYVK